MDSTITPARHTQHVLWVMMIAHSLLVITALVSQARFPVPSEAVGWAIAHQAEQSEQDRPLYRYLWIPPYAIPKSEKYKWNERTYAAMLSYAINESASQTGVIVPTHSIAYGWMVAVYLPNYASATEPSHANAKITQLQRLVDIWDSLATDDAYFHVTKENNVTEVLVEGKTKRNVTRVQRVAVVAPHIERDHALVLNTLSKNPSLVYRADWFIERLLDLNYYDFAQFGKTQFDVYASIGVDEAKSRALDGDQRVGQLRSKVTGKPRRVDRLQGSVGRYGTGAVWQTWDIFDETASVNQIFIKNLLKFDPDGGEAIFEKANGLHGYILYNAKRQLVREAPPNLVADHTIPAPPIGPGTQRLVAGISCIRCHGPSEGLQPCPNEVKAILASGLTDIFHDFDSKQSQQETVLEIAGLFAGDFDERIIIGREQYTAAVRRATSHDDRPEGLDVVELSAFTSAAYAMYVGEVTPERACNELGHVVMPKETPVEKFNAILPTLPPDPVTGLRDEDAFIAALRANIPIRRRDWEQVYAAAMYQVASQKGNVE